MYSGGVFECREKVVVLFSTTFAASAKTIDVYNDHGGATAA
jgi:hypothetical protein